MHNKLQKSLKALKDNNAIDEEFVKLTSCSRTLTTKLYGTAGSTTHEQDFRNIPFLAVGKWWIHLLNGQWKPLNKLTGESYWYFYLGHISEMDPKRKNLQTRKNLMRLAGTDVGFLKGQLWCIYRDMQQSSYSDQPLDENFGGMQLMPTQTSDQNICGKRTSSHQNMFLHSLIGKQKLVPVFFTHFSVIEIQGKTWVAMRGNEPAAKSQPETEVSASLPRSRL